MKTQIGIRNNFYFTLFIFLYFFVISNQVCGQFCGFDYTLSLFYDDHIEHEAEILQNENELRTIMNNDPQAIMNNTVYTIPVVFHVIHLGEAVGQNSNVSDSLIMQALDELNNDFRDVFNNGYDVELEFCLATQDPD